MQTALSRCLVLNTVSAARSLLRRYDVKLKPYGVTVQQFSLLAAIRFHPGETASQLAQRVSLDRTSLGRNLDLLEGKALVRRTPHSGNIRICELTQTGAELLDQLLPEWRAGQDQVLPGLSEEDASTFLRILQQLTTP